MANRESTHQTEMSSVQLANITTRLPHLVQALTTLAQRADHQQTARILLDELSGITVLVAKKFTNDRTADGLLEAFNLTTGCISLGISLADIPKNSESELSFLLHHGAEHVFQMGFRHIKELSALPATAFVADFDRDPLEQQRNIKSLFSQICYAEQNSTWTGDEAYKNELHERKNNQKIIACAQWLRKKHFAGPIKDSELDANAVIAIAVIFAIAGDANIVARTGQKEIEYLIRRARELQPDVEAIWQKWLTKIPPEYQPILRERMAECEPTIVKKILSKTGIKSVIIAMQQYYVGNELDVDYH